MTPTATLPPAVLVLTAQNQRTITLIVRGIDGRPLPLAFSYLRELGQRGYSLDGIVPLVVQ